MGMETTVSMPVETFNDLTAYSMASKSGNDAVYYKTWHGNHYVVSKDKAIIDAFESANDARSKLYHVRDKLYELKKCSKISNSDIASLLKDVEIELGYTHK